MTVRAWHFCNGWKLSDGQPLVVGKTYHVDPPLELYKHGLHGSVRAIDAMKYGSGGVICRVEMSGDIIYDTDMVVATDRRVIAAADATKLLHEWACDCAETALLIGSVADPRSWHALEAKRAWLCDEITDAELAAARDAACAAARAAAYTAVMDAACAAACVAARDTSYSATWDVACAAACDAARAAARAAASDVGWDADWGGAWVEAWAAALDAENRTLEQCLTDLLGGIA